MKKVFVLLILNCCIINNGIAQKNIADSLIKLLFVEQTDTNRVNLMWKISQAIKIYNPDSALKLAQEALFLSRNIKYTEGESRSLGLIANALLSLGNYPRGLEFYLEKLKIEEKRNNQRNMASVIMNIGIVYIYQGEYEKAMPYYYKADSIVKKYNVKDLKYNIALNMGDAYDRMNNTDSSFMYFSKSLEIAQQLKEDRSIGVSLVGLGNTNLKIENYSQALKNYKTALPYLFNANDEDLICETSIGLAKLYKKINKKDSAEYFSRYAYSLAKKDGFLSWQYQSANFLTDHFKDLKNIDSAFVYMGIAQTLKDSIESKDKIRKIQIMTTSEQLRQQDIAENLRKAKKERVQQMQLLIIGLFIPLLFLITLLLSKRRIHVRVIKFLGIISLLMFFEYLTLFLHPMVVEFTNHTPIYEMLIFVTIASLLIPTHHRIENWLIVKLTSGKKYFESGNFFTRKIMIKMKKPSNPENENQD